MKTDDEARLVRLIIKEGGTEFRGAVYFVPAVFRLSLNYAAYVVASGVAEYIDTKAEE